MMKIKARRFFWIIFVIIYFRYFGKPVTKLVLLRADYTITLLIAMGNWYYSRIRAIGNVVDSITDRAG